jgi:hypothetical protein
MGSVSHTGRGRFRRGGADLFHSFYFTADVVDEAFGLVKAPTAKPPTAPATIPIKASTSTFSTRVFFPRFAIDFSLSRRILVRPQWARLLVYRAGLRRANCRKVP